MFNPEDFEEYFEKMRNDETFNSYFSDSFNEIQNKGIGWYLTTISDEQLKTLLHGAREFTRGMLKNMNGSEEEKQNLASHSMKNKSFNIFLNVAVNCISKEANGKDYEVMELLNYLNIFYMVVQFEIAVRDKIIDPALEKKNQHMYVTDIKNTFVDFEINEKGKQIVNDNIVNTLCMN